LQTRDSIENIFAGLPRRSIDVHPLKFFVVLGRDGPRWLVPEDGSNVDPALASWSPYRFSSRLKWHVVRRAKRVGILNLLPFVHSLQFPDANVDWRALGWNACAAPAPLIYIGSPGPTQKVVVHLVDRSSGECGGIVKVPLTSGARDAILSEVATLTDLSRQQYNLAPRLLFVDRERGIATHQFIPGRPGSRRLTPESLELLRSLISPDERTTLAAHAAAREQEALKSLTTDRDIEVMRRAFARIEDDAPLPACWAHGDFAPWNIRQRPDHSPSLIDWEDAQRGGLPLHDAYHFLHIQDFLFGGKPRLHTADLLPFGRSLGLDEKHCRELEIAYLTHAYLQCRSRGDVSRSEFLLETVAIAVRECPVTSPTPAAKRLSPSFSNAIDNCKVRAEIFESLVAMLNRQAIPYCVLGGYDIKPESSAPDVDIMLRAEERPRMPELLMRTARSAGALLVQSIQHETTATYYVLARLEGGRIAYLDVDCYSDYRKNSRSWLLAGDVVARRRKYRSFFIPSIADDFAYYLIKKVLKQSVSPNQLKRLQHLLARNPSECHAIIASFWPSRALLLERAIATQDAAWFSQHLPSLYRELEKSHPLEAFRQRCMGKLRELARCLRRVARPTGMWVEVAGGQPQQQIQLAEEVARRLAPAFRRTRVVAPRTPHTLFTAGPALLLARTRSTLVVRATGPGSSRWRALGQLSSKLTRSALRPDLVLVIEPSGAAPANEAERLETAVHLSPAGDSEEAIAMACRVVLRRLAASLQRRLDLREPGNTASPASDQPDLSPAGSD